MGAGPHSTARAATSWTLEVIWLGVLVVGGIGPLVQRRQARTQAAADARQAELDAALRALDQSRRVLDAMTVVGLGGPIPPQLFHQVQLVEPRVAHRGGPKLPTVVDQGRVTVDAKAIQFRSDTKAVEWRIDRLLHTPQPGRHLPLPVTNRKTISGLQPAREATPGLWAAIAWARTGRLDRPLWSSLEMQINEPQRQLSSQQPDRP